MVSNQLLGARAVAALVVLTVALCGCSHTRGTGESTVAPAPVSAAATAAPAPDMTATEAAIAASGLVVFPKTGHVVNLEEPDLFNQVVGDFLARVDAGRWPARDPRSLPDKSAPLSWNRK